MSINERRADEEREYEEERRDDDDDSGYGNEPEEGGSDEAQEAADDATKDAFERAAEEEIERSARHTRRSARRAPEPAPAKGSPPAPGEPVSDEELALRAQKARTRVLQAAARETKKTAKLNSFHRDDRYPELEKGRMELAWESLAMHEGDVRKAVERMKKMGYEVHPQLMGAYKSMMKDPPQGSDPPPTQPGEALPVPTREAAVERAKVPGNAEWNAKIAARAGRAGMSRSEKYLDAAHRAQANGLEAAAERYLDLWGKAMDAEEAEMERSLTPPPPVAAPLASQPPQVLTDGEKRYRDLVDEFLKDKMKGSDKDPLEIAVKAMDAVAKLQSKLGGTESDDVAVARIIGDQFEHGLDRATSTVKEVWGRKKIADRGKQDPNAIVVECPNRQCKSKIKGWIDDPPTECPRCGTRIGAIRDTDGTLIHRRRPAPAAPSAPAEPTEDVPECFAGAPKWGQGIDPADAECQRCIVAQACTAALAQIRSGQATPPPESGAAERMEEDLEAADEGTDEEETVVDQPEEKNAMLPSEAFDLWDNLHRIAEWVTNFDHESVLNRFRSVYGLAVNRQRKIIDRRNEEGFNMALYIAEIEYGTLLEWMGELAKHPEIVAFAKSEYEDDDADMLVRAFADEDHRKTLEAALEDFRTTADEDGLSLTEEAKGDAERRIRGWIADAQPQAQEPAAPNTQRKRAASSTGPPVQPPPVKITPAPTKDTRPTLCPVCDEEGKPKDEWYPKGGQVAIDDLKEHMSAVHVKDNRHPDDPMAKGA